MKEMNFNTVSIFLLVVVAAVFVGRYFYFQPKYINGETAPNFSAQTLNGERFALEELEGNLVLIDFWGSWCPPCRAENPSLVALYQKYHGKAFKKAKNFEIVSIGIERKDTSWKNAIQRDRLNWPHHVMDTTNNYKFFDGKISGAYGIKQVPTKYLINENGVIIRVDPSIEDLDMLLAAQLR
ncbi:MAG: TlpA family protein disulfide reductase [Saprospiraceae bacterium]|nr:TlpA family protein disulfide reductase [Saprospiraceae bacterium]